MDYQANILIVDDLPENLLALEITLGTLGQNLVRATSGEEALRHLLKDDFAVVLLDVSMPEMNGFELAELIRQRERSRHTPIIFITAYAHDDEYLRRGYELGAIDYLFKPYRPEILRWKVGVLVDLYLKTLESEHYAEIQRLNEKLEQANWALTQHNVRINELYRLSREIGRSRNSLQILELLASSTFLSDAAYLAVYIFDKPWNGGSAPIGHIEAVWYPGSDSPSETWESYEPALAFAEEVFISEDIATDLRLKAAARHGWRQQGIQSLIQFPLTASGTGFGSLIIHWQCPLPLQMDDVRHVQGLVDQVAASIYNLRLLQIESEARQKAEQADQLKSKFLRLVSHELRTPLTSIKGFVTTLLEPDVTWDELSQKQFLAILNEEADNLTDLIDHLLTMTSVQADTLRLVLQPYQVQALISEAHPRFTSLCTGHALIIDIPSDLPYVQMDASRITQVFVHLLTNAAKYSPQHAPITLRAALRGDVVQIDIHDAGRGIPASERDLVFEPFYHAENRPVQIRGAGLGLAIARAIVERHHGAIWIEPDEEPGMTISFTLPVALVQDGEDFGSHR